eukprot:9890878-Alexandrium_andersonii.AAC.1
MSASLVGSEMCIRDSHSIANTQLAHPGRVRRRPRVPKHPADAASPGCLLYTSDAADVCSV